jgi:hypothetical protein
MTQKENILQELTELKSMLTGFSRQQVYTVPAGYFESLAEQVLSRIRVMEAAADTESRGYLSFILNNFSKEIPYSVPAGYFEGLVAQVLNRIKAMEAQTATGELGYLSPVLSKLSRQLPYTVPAGYFEGLSEKALQIISAEKAELSAKEELETISPFLSGLKKEMPFSVPPGYFENIVAAVNKETAKPEVKVISIASRKWFRYAVAAVVVGVIATAGLLFINRDKVTADKDSYAWVKKNIKKVSTENLEEFVGLSDDEKAIASVDTKIEQEVKDLVKDIPENEIQSLLNDTKILDDTGADDASDKALMN